MLQACSAALHPLPDGDRVNLVVISILLSSCVHFSFAHYLIIKQG